MLSLLQMVAAAGCLCRKCDPPVQMEKRDWSSHLICEPPQVWAKWECPACGYWVVLRFEDEWMDDKGKVVDPYLRVTVKEEVGEKKPTGLGEGEYYYAPDNK